MNDLKRCGVVVLFSVIIILTLLFAQWFSFNAPEWMMFSGGRTFGLGTAMSFAIVLGVEAFIGKVVFDRIPK